MSVNSLKPPLLHPGEPYDTWKTKIRIWEKCTTIPVDARAPAVVLTLEGAASTVAIKIPLETLASAEGINILIAKLDGLFDEDKDQITYSVYDRFEQFRKSDGMSMTEYLVQFELLYDKAKQYGNILTEPVKAYRLLKGANLSEEKQALARATCSEWKYETLKLQLKKIFDQTTSDKGKSDYLEGAVGGFSEMQIKSEPTNFTQSMEEEELYFTRGGRGSSRRSNYGNFNERNNNQYELNPIVNGVRLKCIACKSIYHLIRNCKYKNTYRRGYDRNQNSNWRSPAARDAFMADEEDEEPEEVYIQLLTSTVLKSKDTEKEISDCYVTSLVGECLGKCILDCGCNCNVAGEGWSKSYIDGLEDKDRKRIGVSPSKTKFRFGDGTIHQATKKLNVPAEIGSNKVMIEYHVIDAELPLLLSKTGMRDAGCVIDFQKEKVTMFGKQINLDFTRSGHYTIPLTPKVRAGSEDRPVNIMFSTVDLSDKTEEEKKKMIIKIHKTFGHPTEIRLKKLIKDGGIEDKEVMKAVEDVSNQCETCVKYKKPPLRPAVCIPIARTFNEVVTLDLFFHNQKPILHLCDAATRFSRASVIPSKKTDTVISCICILWISIFGPPQKMLADRGGEFSSHDFREMGEKLNTKMISTAAESPWSNGINERHHSIITNMMEKIMEENKLPLQVALSWACAAKNALSNVYGYSPNQLLFGTNPNYPSVLTSELPALETQSNSETILNNIKSMVVAREAFIKAESSEKLKRAIKSKVRPATSLDYQVGEEVYYKRNSENRWQGPGRIIGIDGKCILVKHQSSVVAVSPCRIAHRPLEVETDNKLPDNHNQRIESSRISDVEDEDDGWGIITEHDRSQREEQDVKDALPANEAIDEVAEEITVRRRGRPPSKKNKPETIELPPSNSEIKFKMKGEDEWHTAKVIDKAGKRTGDNKNFMNLQVHEFLSEEKRCVDFLKVETWIRNEAIDEETEEILFGTILEAEEVKTAQQEEIQKWKENEVYECVEDEGQQATSVRWVISKKNDKVKARLVARGYEETCFQEMRKDSPTIGKPVFRLSVAIVTSMKWEVNILDVQSAYLQGKRVERDIYLNPPTEAENPNQLWKLHKAVYGLGDGGRQWYLKVESEIMKLGAKKSKYDVAVFTWYRNDKLDGIITSHVDDFFWGGSEEFRNSVIKKVTETFKISKEEDSSFKYLGLEVKQKQDMVEIAQTAYMNAIKPIELTEKKEKDQKLDNKEKKDLRTYVGQIQWLASQTRPDLSFSACEVSVEFSKATVNTIYKCNKTIRRMKNNEVKLRFPNLGDLSKCSIQCYTDASLNNLPGNASQIGFIILLSNGVNVSPITWKSSKAKRVVRSTIAAECLALSEGAGMSYYIRQVLSGILNKEPESIPIHCYIDNKNLNEAIHSTHSVLDARVYADIAEMRDKLEQKEITSINWIPGDQQLANIFTKSGASAELLLNTLESSKVVHQ